MPRLMMLPLILVLPGCTYSVHPLLTERDLTEDVDLTGKWELQLPTPNPKTVPNAARSKPEPQRIPLTLEKYDKSTYDFYLSEQFAKASGDDNWPEAWTLQIGKIGDQTYGQLIPRDHPPQHPLFSGIPVYYLGRMELSDNCKEVRFYPMLDNESAVLAKREKLPHITYEPSDFVQLTVFTGSSSDLQKMVTSHGKQLFSPRPVVLRLAGDR